MSSDNKNNSSELTKPLSGIKVLDLSAVISGPMCAALLADQGADVIKVERVVKGDIQRHVGSSRGGLSGLFHVLNRGKQSLALDLKSEKARAVIFRLVEGMDVIIQNFRPGVVERLGLAWSDLQKINPRIVYLSINGFGASGPDANKKAYDPIIQARSGISWVQGDSGFEGYGNKKDETDGDDKFKRNNKTANKSSRPEQVKHVLLDKLTAHQGAQAVTAALFQRERNGQGRHIEISMLDVAVSFIWSDAAADKILLGDNIDHRPPVRASGYLAKYKDDQWISTIAVSDAEFQALCKSFNMQWLAEDPRFKTIQMRQRNRAEWRAVMEANIDEVAAGLTVNEAISLLSQNQVPNGLAQNLDQLPNDEQVEHNKILVTTEHPVAGALREARPPPIVNGKASQPAGPAPMVGQHSRKILTDIGLEEEIDQLIAEGIVSTFE